MKTEYQTLINEFDKTLKLLSRKFFEANLKDKKDWLERINSALDERLRLMKLRDS